MTEKELKQDWNKEWKELQEIKQLMVWAVYGKDTLREMFKNEFGKMMSPERLAAEARRYFLNRGWNIRCYRCKGSGDYLNYGTCLKCHGIGVIPTSPTILELEWFMEKYPEGLINVINKESGPGKISNFQMRVL